MEEIVGQLIPIVVSLFGALASIAVVRLNRWLKVKGASEATNVIGDVTASVVSELSIMAGAFKERATDGKLTTAEVQDLKSMAIGRVRTGVSDAVTKIAMGAVGNLDAYISGKIEQKVREAKK